MSGCNTLPSFYKRHIKHSFRFKLYRYRYLIAPVIIFTTLFILYIFGILERFGEIEYNDSFLYNLPPSNLKYYIEVEKKRSLNGNVFQRFRMNNFSYTYRYSPVKKCKNPQKLFIIVRTAACNREARDAIRSTWGNESQLPGVAISTAFILGHCGSQRCKSSVPCQDLLDAEYSVHEDLIQADFMDTYLNSTEKMFAAFNWVVRNCAKTQFAFFADDDFYVSIKNLLSSAEKYSNYSLTSYMYMGHVFHSRPMREKFSKHYISLAEYPFNQWPPYATGGCFLVNNVTLVDLFYAGLHVRKFRFDDVYLGMIAKQLKIDLINNEEIYVDKAIYEARKYRKVVASHWYNDPVELRRVWGEQKMLGNA